MANPVNKSRVKVPGFTGIYSRCNRIQIKFTWGGKTHYQPVGLDLTKPNIKAAAKILETVEAQINMGLFDFAEFFPNSKTDTVINEQMTVAKLCDLWFDNWKKNNPLRSNSSRRGHTSIINNHFKPRAKLGTRAVQSITKTVLVNWHSSLQTDKGGELSPSQLGKIHTVAQFIFSYAEGLGVFKDGNPWNEFKAFYEHHLKRTGESNSISLDVPLTKEELERILAAPGCEQTKNAIRFNTAMGLRTGELYGLTWDRIDWENKTVLIDRQMTHGHFKGPKYKSIRTLTLTHAAIEALKAQQKFIFQQEKCDVEFHADKLDKDGAQIIEQVKGAKFVFSNPQTNRHYCDGANFASRWYSLLEAANVARETVEGETRTPYTMRHTFASRLFTNGAPIEFVARELGNTPGVCRKRYARIIPSEQKFDHSLKNQYLG